MGEETRLKINDRSSYPPRVSVLTRRLGICYRRVTREKDRSFSLQARSYRPLQTISSSIFFILKRTVRSSSLALGVSKLKILEYKIRKRDAESEVMDLFFLDPTVNARRNGILWSSAKD